MSPNEWQPVFVMPNIHIKQSFESKYCAIVSKEDSRYQTIVESNPDINKVLNSFVDYTGRRHQVSLFLFRNDIPKRLRTPEAIASFRNIFALSCIIDSYIGVNLNPNKHIVYSDYFEFYPIGISLHSDLLIVRNPVQHGLISFDSFKEGQTNPALMHIEVESNYTLSNLLLNYWQEYYENNNPTRKASSLLNSLEIAYNACTLPISNLQSLYDYGIRAALWVNAFEVLVHPNHSYANLSYVLECISSYKFKENMLNYNRFFYWKEKKRQTRLWVSFPCKLYQRLYRARCSFMHGESVSGSLFVYKRKSHRSINLLSVAPLLYAIAIVSNLDIDKKLDLTHLLILRTYLRNIEHVLKKLLLS